MHNVYSFNATVISNKDKRKREEVKVSADAASLNQAWDKAERKVAKLFPDHSYTMTMGNRQPIHLRPAFKELAEAS